MKSARKMFAKRVSLNMALLAMLSTWSMKSMAENELPPNLEIAVSNQFLNKVTRVPIDTTQHVNTRVSGADIATLIHASGVAFVSPWQTGRSGLGFCLGAESNIHSDIDAQIAGPARVFVRTDAVALTNTRSNKCFFLDDNGLKSYAAVTNAATRLTVQNLDVWAGGIFRRLKTRIGYRKAREEMSRRIPQQEREISERAVSTINELLDSKTVSMVDKVTALWREWIQKATTGSGLLPRPMRLFSTSGAAYIYVPSDDQRQRMELTPSGNEAVALRVRPDYIRDVAQVYLAGLTISDIEILSAMVKAVGEYAIPEDLIGSPDEVVMRFAADRPVDVIFQNDVINLINHFDQIETNGKIYKNVTITLPIILRTHPATGLTVVIPSAIEVRQSVSGEIEPELTEHLSARWKVIATTTEFQIEPLLKKLAPGLPIRISKATAMDNQLTMTAVNGEASEFNAITAKLSKMLIP